MYAVIFLLRLRILYFEDVGMYVSIDIEDYSVNMFLAFDLRRFRIKNSLMVIDSKYREKIE